MTDLPQRLRELALNLKSYDVTRKTMKTVRDAASSLDAAFRVCKAAEEVVRHESDGGSRLVLEVDLQRLEAALTAWKAAREGA